MEMQYKFLPMVYDRWQQSYGKEYAVSIVPRVLSTLARYKVAKGTLLDLGCGTGTFALRMASRGWEVIALDRSAGMIEEARRKHQTRGKPVLYLLDDMRTFKLPMMVNVVTCCFDTLNHLHTMRDLHKTLQSAYTVLEPHGLFLFDVNNEKGFSDAWPGRQIVEEDGFTLVLHNDFNRVGRWARSTARIYVNGPETYSEYVEVIRQRWFRNFEITSAIEKTGFDLLESKDFSLPGRSDAGKIKTWWVLQKPRPNE